MTSELSGTTAIVTGGASGIGAACARRLAAEGVHVVITDMSDGLGEHTASEIVAQGGRATFQHHDVTKEDEWIAVVTAAVHEGGSLDIVVNNAGIGIGGSILETDLADFQRQMAINVDGVFLGMKHTIAPMRDSGGGSIINMSSVAGLRGSPRLAGYNASKGAVRLMTKGVALEAAHNRWNVRVNSVHPGIIDTPIWETVGAAAIPGAGSVDIDRMARSLVPGGNLGQPNDVADVVLFLASDASRYITGTEIVVDAGMSA